MAPEAAGSTTLIGASAPAQILADIADLVGDLPEKNQPLSMVEPTRTAIDDDDLAILAAQENAAEAEALVSSGEEPSDRGKIRASSVRTPPVSGAIGAV